MRLDKIDLNLFVVLEALYREGSVTRVAAQLNLTQPAVSNALSRLRQTFDDPLFVRMPEGMVPTPLTEAVIGDVRRALNLLGASVGSNARFEAGESEKNFRLGMNDLAEALVLPRLQQSLKVTAPGVSVHCYYTDRASASEDLKSGKLDLLLDMPLISARDFESESLGSFPYIVAMRPGHPLAGQPLSVESYLNAEHVHVSSRRKGKGQVDIGLRALGKQRRVMMRVQSYLVAAQVVRETDLIWTVPAALTFDMGLATSPVPFAVEPLAWSLFWHKSAADDPATQWMRKQLTTAARDVFESKTR